MRVLLAGVCMETGPDRELSASERLAIRCMGQEASRGEPATGRATFRIRLGRRPLKVARRPGGPGPAEVSVSGELVQMHHRDFEADLDVAAGHGVLRRDRGTTFPVESTLRTALCCRLPLIGGVALHAAGIIVDGQGFVFYGPSGAGKSTLAGTSPHPVVSDELVAVAGDPFELRHTGFWGELGARGGAPLGAPLAALVELAKGPHLELTPIDPATAFRRLLGAVVLPPAPALWRPATAVVARLVATVPVLRLAWHPAAPPWPALEAFIQTNHGHADGRRRLA